MIFTTWTFAAFAVVAYGAYAIAVAPRRRLGFLVAAGALFYAWSVPAYLALIVALGGVTFAAARALSSEGGNGRRKAIVVAAIAVNAGALGYFKYAGFFAQTVDAATRSQVVPLPHLVVPLAISFFTFEYVHVLADAYARRLPPLRPLEFATFAAFFPTMIAGPIKRYQSFVPQLRAIELPGPREAGLNLYRVALGFVKKLVIADSASLFTRPLLAPGPAWTSWDYALALLAYAVKIYFDFSGYSDIAIGLAGLFGLRVPENFDRPYRARDISQFWRRWHASLSAWVRDYVFVPLGGSRRPAPLVALNLLLAMAIVGLWHGAAWGFVVWGIYHGVGLAVHRAWAAFASTARDRRPPGAIGAGLATAATFAFVTIGWAFFATASLPDAATVLLGLVVRPAVANVNPPGRAGSPAAPRGILRR